MERQYNMRSPAVKRLMKEAQELHEPTEQYHAQPLEDNLFEWHFTIRGPADSEFGGGIYHGRILLPPEYPMKPPSIMLLTPNGRFETYKKICLSISGYHPESWQPSWSIRTALLAIIGFMPTHGGGAIGSLDYTPEERKVLAKKSQDWKCNTCGDLSKVLKPVTEASEKTRQEAKELASQINFQAEKQATDNNKTTEPTNIDSSKENPNSEPNLQQAAFAAPQMPFLPPFMFPFRPPQGTQTTVPGPNSVPFMRPGFPMFPWPPAASVVPGMPATLHWFPRPPGSLANAVPGQQSTNNSAINIGAAPNSSSAGNGPVAGVNNLRQRQNVRPPSPVPRSPPQAPPAPPTQQRQGERSNQMYLIIIGLALCILLLLFRRFVLMGI